MIDAGIATQAIKRSTPSCRKEEDVIATSIAPNNKMKTDLIHRPVDEHRLIAQNGDLKIRGMMPQVLEPRLSRHQSLPRY